MNGNGESERVPAPPPDEAVVPLIPLLRPGEAVADRVVLSTWHEALSDSLGVDLPHDLFALWLYPTIGGVELLGPEALAQDHLPVPVPKPTVTDEQANALGEIVREAGYRSVVCVPIRFAQTDVGLLLVADLKADRYGPRERAVIGQLAQALGPTLARIARVWAPPADPSSATDFVAQVATAWTEARSPRDFLALVSRAVSPLLPHDRLELLIPGPNRGQQYRLGAHAGNPPWAEPSLIVSREVVDLVALFAGEPSVRIDDTREDSRWPTGYPADDLPEGQAIRSLLGVRVMSGGRLVAHLFAAGVAPDLYESEDLELFEEVARLLAPKVEAYVLASQLFVLRKQMGALRNAPAHLARVADMLATTPKFAEATSRLADAVREMLPCDGLAIALRVGEGDRAVLMEPGETRHPADLPRAPAAGTMLGQVLRGELADALTETPKQSELIVPLRAAGRVVGALILSARGFGALGRSDVLPLQQLADIVAPYVELFRRAATLPAPVTPGLRRVR
jgi:GAF domain-containing protein